MLSTWVFTFIVVVSGYLLYRYGYFRGVVDSEKLRKEIERIQNNG